MLFCCLLIFFFKLTFKKKKFFQEYHQNVIQLDPDLDPNSLPRLSANDTGRKRVNVIYGNIMDNLNDEFSF